MSQTSGLRLLSVPREALAARLAVVRAARETLDLQYYIWHRDSSGLGLLDAVRAAADRGVRVRLLLDDNGIRGLDRVLAVIDAHPRIDVRLFNPFPHRHHRWLDLLLHFTQVNRRMHNKSLTADRSVTIVGGRNVGDEYFGTHPAVDFADLDALAAGEAAARVAEVFEQFWNSPLAVPLASCEPAPTADDVDTVTRALREAARTATAANDLATLTSDTVDDVPVEVMADAPTKADTDATNDSPGGVSDQLAAAFGAARRELDLVSSYFVPGSIGTAALTSLAQRDVRVRIVTNSLATSDVAAVHAGYARHRAALLRAGVQLFELKRGAAGPVGHGSGPVWMPTRTGSTASLHGKTFVVDRERLFVGSFNLDPRSVWLNTEMGLLIDSAPMASAFSSSLDRDLDDVAYEVRLDGAGHLQWIDHQPTGDVVFHRDPHAGWWLRAGVTALSWLPIDWLL